MAEKRQGYGAAITRTNQRIKFEYAGDCTKYADVLTDGILKGIISEYVDDSINLINARVYADDVGLKGSDL